MLKHGWAEIQLLHHRSCQASLGMLLILSIEYWSRMAPVGLFNIDTYQQKTFRDLLDVAHYYCSVWKPTNPTMVRAPFSRNIGEIILLLRAPERKIGVFPDCQKNKNKKNLKWWKMTHCRDCSWDGKENSFLKQDKELSRKLFCPAKEFFFRGTFQTSWLPNFNTLYCMYLVFIFLKLDCNSKWANQYLHTTLSFTTSSHITLSNTTSPQGHPSVCWCLSLMRELEFLQQSGWLPPPTTHLLQAKNF